MIKKADDAYINYRHRCESLAKEAQKYIDWDDKAKEKITPDEFKEISI